MRPGTGQSEVAVAGQRRPRSCAWCSMLCGSDVAIGVARAPIPADERAALKRMDEATAGAEPSEAFSITLVEEMQAAKSPEQLAAILAREGLLHEDD